MAKFKKGESGNPGGRPKEIGHVRDLAQAHTEDSIETLAEIRENKKAPAAARVAAAQALLDRGWGKPGISVGLGQAEDLKPLPVEPVLRPRITREEWLKLYSGDGKP